MSDQVKQLRSGRKNNDLIETLGGMQHYVSNLKAADTIEKLQSYVTHLETEWVLTDDLAEARSSFQPPESET